MIKYAMKISVVLKIKLLKIKNKKQKTYKYNSK